MRVVSSQRFLTIYSGVLTLVFGLTVLCGFARPHKTSFDELDVHRINIVEPDGTLRMVISNKAEFPGLFIKGKEMSRSDRPAAGVLFFNNEATEMGGLIYGGTKDQNGKIHNAGHLSFDQYMQDQVFSIDAGQDEANRYSLISFADRGDYPITEALEAQKKIQALPPQQQKLELDKFLATHPGDASRILFGRDTDASTVLRMRDKRGRDRLVIKVTADGSPAISLLDENGKVLSQLPPPKS